ncbi:MAG: ABC transporter substrate-binding protein [Aquabacterium sp.]
MSTRRRWLAAGATWPALAWTSALRAQAPSPVVIGSLVPGGRGDGRGTRAFNEGMAALGWKLGTQYVLEERFADGRADQLPALAQELATRKPAVIVVMTSVAARAAAAAAPTTPIVLANGDPLSTGLVANLARPGGMITGLSNISAELNLKLFELLLEAMPRLKRVGFLNDSTSARHAAVREGLRATAERLRVEAVIVDVAKPADIEPAMDRLAKEKVQALVLLASVWFGTFHPKILDLASARRWPVASMGAGTARSGGLFSYGPDQRAMLQRSASYVDRILKGAKPGDLPIEQPTSFSLVLNMKTARALGITIPSSVLIRATEVIE